MQLGTTPDKWLRAATIGSLWASVEIIIGSFLHNIRLPLAGTILAFFSVVLMVSFLRIWPQKGIIWRAALICALMKSISPSAVILGPMTGIFLEGLLVELGILVFGINLAGMMAGGMLAVFSALVHKALNLLILYGWNLAELLNNLVKFATRQIGLQTVEGTGILAVLAGIYLFSGAAAAIAGNSLGKRTIQVKDSLVKNQVKVNPANTLFNYSDPGKYSAWLLLLHMAVIVLILLAMNRLEAWIASLLTIPYLAGCFLRYRRSLQQLLRPKLWIQLLLITFLAAIFLNGLKSGNWLDFKGLKAGLMMNLRALVMLTGFSAISMELKNPVIRTILYGRGFASLYKSLSMAFTVLPEIAQPLNGQVKKLRGLGKILESKLIVADELLERFRTMDRSLPPVTIITGDRGEGKTTFLKNKIRDLQMQGLRVTGFIAEGIQKDGRRTGYRIINVNTGEKAEFCLESGKPEWERTGRYYIDPQGLAKGYEWLDPECIRQSDLVVIDELGPLELSGRGWDTPITRILREEPKPMIWTVRRKLVKKIAHKWNIGKTEIIDIAATI